MVICAVPMLPLHAATAWMQQVCYSLALRWQAQPQCMLLHVPVSAVCKGCTSVHVLWAWVLLVDYLSTVVGS